MPSPLLIDPALFDPAAIPAETRALNDEIVRRLNAEPTGLTVPEIRARRIAGIGAFPPAPKSPRAETITIDGPAGLIELRVIAPAKPRGVFFHIHGGGWSIGAPDQNDPLLESIADGSGPNIPIRRVRTTARRRRFGCCGKGQSGSASSTSRSGGNRPAGIWRSSRCCGCATSTSSTLSRRRFSITAATTLG